MPVDEHFSGRNDRYLLGLLVARRQRVALVLGGQNRWHRAGPSQFAPLEFVGSNVARSETPGSVADELARRVVGVPCRLVSSRHTYGSTAQHAIDRLAPLPDESPHPLLRLVRGVPEDRGVAERQVGLAPLTVCMYHAAVDGELVPGTQTGGLVWMPLDALRSVVRGLPFGEMLMLDGVEWIPNPLAPPPDETAVIYCPSEYGERFLLRVAAKYGHEAVLSSEEAANGTGA